MDGQASVETVILTGRNCTDKQLDTSTTDCLSYMLRVVVKTEPLTNKAENPEAHVLSNYHIKTLMMWACEMKSSIFWTDDLNLIRICVELLRTCLFG